MRRLSDKVILSRGLRAEHKNLIRFRARASHNQRPAIPAASSIQLPMFVRPSFATKLKLA